MKMTRRAFCTSVALGMVGTGSNAPSGRAEHNARTDRAVPTAPSRSAIPRVDAQAHIAGDTEVIGQYLALRRFMLETHDVDLAMWIDLASSSNLTPDPQQNLAAAAL